MHAEVAGGGIAGLAVGTMLAMRGWSVRVHEQNDSIREVGAGIFLRPNSMAVLSVLGVANELKNVGLKLESAKYRDGRTGETYQDRLGGDGSGTWICPRELMIQALERRAREAGVEISIGSRVLGATREGVLKTAKGAFPADLVIGADGVSSAVRNSLGLTKRTQRLSTVATRYLAPTRDIEPIPQTTMYWSGSRRVGISPVSKDSSYIYMICPDEDERGKALPMDIESWSEAFPILRNQLEQVRDLTAIQNNYRIVQCHAWHSGRVAIIGDGAHGLPPLLGQGAGLALCNANALATSVGNDSSDIPRQLVDWETRFRRYSDITQNWSMHFDRATNDWPPALLALRKPYLWALGKIGPVQRRIWIADDFPVRAIA